MSNSDSDSTQEQLQSTDECRHTHTFSPSNYATLQDAAQALNTDEVGIYEMFLDERLTPSVLFINAAPVTRTQKTSRTDLWQEAKQYGFHRFAELLEIRDGAVLLVEGPLTAGRHIIEKHYHFLKHGISKELPSSFGLFVQRGDDVMRLQQVGADGVVTTPNDLPNDAVLVVHKDDLATYKAKFMPNAFPRTAASANRPIKTTEMSFNTEDEPGNVNESNSNGPHDPKLRNGRNGRAAVERWVKHQAKELKTQNDTAQTLSEKILSIAERNGYESERGALKVKSIIRMLPQGITGGRQKNGVTKKVNRHADSKPHANSVPIHK